MRASRRWRTWGLVCALLAVGACKGGGAVPKDGGGLGGADGGLTGCLDQPGALDRPPNGQLPCELIPPGLTL